jgi:hypothetical protein
MRLSCPANPYEEPVTWEAIARVFAGNAAKVTALLTGVIPRI